jgi:hypothetical protein
MRSQRKHGPDLSKIIVDCKDVEFIWAYGVGELLIHPGISDDPDPATPAYRTGLSRRHAAGARTSFDSA